MVDMIEFEKNINDNCDIVMDWIDTLVLKEGEVKRLNQIDRISFTFYVRYSLINKPLTIYDIFYFYERYKAFYEAEKITNLFIRGSFPMLYYDRIDKYKKAHLVKI